MGQVEIKGAGAGRRRLRTAATRKGDGRGRRPQRWEGEEAAGATAARKSGGEGGQG